MSGLPSGLLTILFTDIAGSTELWDTGQAEMREAHLVHNEILTNAFATHGGTIVKDKGDGFIVVFAKPVEAVESAALAQKGLATADWPRRLGGLRVRMALNTGEVEPEGDDYYGPVINETARLETVAHGGQVLVSETTRSLTERHLSPGLQFRDLGESQFRGLSRPQRVFQLVVGGLESEFPDLKSSTSRGQPLPSFDDTFIGRDEETAALRSMIDGGSRLVTLLGPGGIGKTRLAVEVAGSYQEALSGGVHFADLAPLSSPNQVGEAVAESVGVHAEGTADVLELVAKSLTDPTLLVVDNFEHVIGARKALGDLISSASALTVIATSLSRSA